MPGRILILDDEERIVSLLAKSLERSGYEARGFTEPARALEELKAGAYDVLLTDLRMPGLDGLQVLERVKRIAPTVEVILMTAYASVDTVREAMKRGAVDYLTKPVSAEEDLKPLLARLLSDGPAEGLLPPPAVKARSAAGPHPPPPRVAEDPQCPSSAMQEIYRKALKVARSNATVLLRGESGTGKEVLADLIQANSPRAEKPYVKVNCGALPEALLEAELFGHVKGSFTGAVADRDGLFTAADGGTILLDEIGEITPPLQVKLLRVLQQGEFHRVGDSAVRKVDVRVLAATNRPLERLIETGEFRQDLYYRLNVVPLVLPPLRERPEDLDFLLRAFARRFAPGTEVHFSPAAVKAIHDYPWPGNIRELENAVEHALVLGEAGNVQLEDLPAPVQENATRGVSPRDNLSALVGKASLEDIEKNCLLQALEKTRGNRTRAARILNITRRTLGYRLRKYDLEEEVNRRYGGTGEGDLNAAGDDD